MHILMWRERSPASKPEFGLQMATFPAPWTEPVYRSREKTRRKIILEVLGPAPRSWLLLQCPSWLCQLEMACLVDIRESVASDICKENACVVQAFKVYVNKGVACTEFVVEPEVRLVWLALGPP